MSHERPQGHDSNYQYENQGLENPEILSALSRLAPEYQTYCDMMAEKGKGMPEERKKKFLEFIAELNSKYLEFLNAMLEKQMEAVRSAGKRAGLEDLEKFAQDYERRLEFFENNYALPLSDQEAVEALMFLKKDSRETAEIKIKAWRELAKEFDYADKEHPEQDQTDKPLIYLARAGFNLKDKAPEVRDEHSKKDQGLCYQNFKYLQDLDFPDNPAQDEIRYFIPRLVPESTNLNFEEQEALIQEISERIKEKYEETKNIDISMGEANRIANQILVHYNHTGERVPLKNSYARTKTLRAGGGRLRLGGFGAGGLNCGSWGWGGDRRPGLGSFLSGVEPLEH